jgi:hypothetical protein
MRPPSGTFVLPSEVADEIVGASAPGTLVVRIDPVENVALIVGFGPDGGTAMTDLMRPFVRGHYTSATDTGQACRCHAAEADLHAAGIVSVMHGGAVPLDYFKSQLRGKTRKLRGHYVTYAPDAEEPLPKWLGWFLADGTARFFPVEVIQETRDPLDDLGDAWPTRSVRSKHVGVVGVGSIGSAAAEGLAGYGIGSIHLIDFDRLEQHNLPRHVLTSRDIGRRKTHAMADHLHRQHPHLTAIPHELDIVHDADAVRDLLPRWDAVVVATDGVESRLAANWLAAHARIPATFACVLEDGALGEIVRSLPGEGCLICNRAGLRERGTWDPEPGIDLDYGTGVAHRPMTAVGADLAYVGRLAAKTAVATVLERDGYRDQRIDGNHAAVGLRPGRRYTAPFDHLHHGDTRWTRFHRRPDCHVCATPP